MIEKSGPGPKVRVGLNYLSTFVCNDWHEATAFAAGIVRIGRANDELSWEAIVATATEASKGLPLPTLEAHDAAPDIYWARCTLVCESAAPMMKMSVRQFQRFGLYMCTQCGIVYEPDQAPLPFDEKLRYFLGIA